MRISVLAIGAALVTAALVTPSAFQLNGCTSSGFPGSNTPFGGPITCTVGPPPAGAANLLTAQSAISIPAGRVQDVELADVNGDGALDAVLLIDDGSANQREIAVVPGDGHGGFGAATLYSTPFPAQENVVLDHVDDGVFGVIDATAQNLLPVQRIALADVNGDGHVDIVFPGTSAQLEAGFGIMLGSAAGTFGTPTITMAPSYDLNPSGSTVINPVGLLPVPPGTPDTLAGAASVAVGDINGDGRPDVVLSRDIPVGLGPIFGIPTSETLIDSWTGNGAGGFTYVNTTQLSAADNQNAFALVDLRGAGTVDLVTDDTPSVGAAQGVATLQNDGAGRFGPPTVQSLNTSFSVLTGVASSLAGDLNGDGHPDILQFDGAQFCPLLNDGVGALISPAACFAGTATPAFFHLPLAAALADVDHDGKLDAIGVSDDGGSGHFVSLLLGDGAGNFSNPAFFATSQQNTALATGDVNHDGGVDVVSAGNGVLTVLLGTPVTTTVTFTHFQAAVDLDRREFGMDGVFTLGAGSDGIDPVKDGLTLTIGSFSRTIPAGAFTAHKGRHDRPGEIVADHWTFEGRIDGFHTEATITELGKHGFAIHMHGQANDLPKPPKKGTTLTVQLILGNDQGTDVVHAR